MKENVWGGLGAIHLAGGKHTRCDKIEQARKAKMRPQRFEPGGRRDTNLRAGQVGARSIASAAPAMAVRSVAKRCLHSAWMELPQPIGRLVEPDFSRNGVPGVPMRHPGKTPGNVGWTGGMPQPRQRFGIHRAIDDLTVDQHAIAVKNHEHKNFAQ